MYFKVLVVLLLINSSCRQQDISPIVDIKTLSELPLERLLQVKKTLNNDKHIDDIQPKSDVPEALALHTKSTPYDRGGHVTYHYEGHSKKGGKKSIQSIFQISVTTLAFVAFGGYLLCLLCQALADKNMNNTQTQIMTAALMRPVIIRRTTRRPQRYRRPTRRPSNPRPRNKRGVDYWPEVTDPENMYFALVQLSEAYTQYHTIEYRQYNYTTKLYS